MIQIYLNVRQAVTQTLSAYFQALEPMKLNSFENRRKVLIVAATCFVFG